MQNLLLPPALSVALPAVGASPLVGVLLSVAIYIAVKRTIEVRVGIR